MLCPQVYKGGRHRLRATAADRCDVLHHANMPSTLPHRRMAVALAINPSFAAVITKRCSIEYVLRCAMQKLRLCNSRSTGCIIEHRIAGHWRPQATPKISAARTENVIRSLRASHSHAPSRAAAKARSRCLSSPGRRSDAGCCPTAAGGFTGRTAAYPLAWLGFQSREVVRQVRQVRVI